MPSGELFKIIKLGNPTTQQRSVKLYLKAHSGIKASSEKKNRNLKAGFEAAESESFGSGSSFGSGFRSVSLSSDQRNVSISPGQQWVRIYSELGQHNLSVAGGRTAPVGVGGFLLGVQPADFLRKGGISYWRSTNYGFVTRYTLPTIDLDEMWGGSLVMGLEQAPALFEFLANYTEAVNVTFQIYEDANGGLSAVSLSWDPDTQNYTAASFDVYLKPQEFPPLFAGLREFVPEASVNTLRIANLTAFATETAGGDPSGSRVAWWTLTVAADSQLIQDIFAQGQSHFADLLKLNGATTTWSLTTQPINRQMINATIANGSPVGFTAQDAENNLFLVLEHLKWTDASLDDEMESRSQSFLSMAQYLAKQRNMLNDGSQLIYERVGQEHLSKLTAVKADVDPENVLGKLWTGTEKALELRATIWVPLERSQSVINSQWLKKAIMIVFDIL
ncbi:hypothetical protein K435DRAFT_808069 [Dendrothele bispora CBS 962.96]|uniref:Uncharacterized protein n=1 Tax=Dendrothele bispora (strain CBS 962.96) TaxID=1314807 RepID=A0A4S8L3Y7_DENBC|nr:hypothetical protein K435DRAFT_808069 [Dendrothele bispora CBS 962.96]